MQAPAGGVEGQPAAWAAELCGSQMEIAPLASRSTREEGRRVKFRAAPFQSAGSSRSLGSEAVLAPLRRYLATVFADLQQSSRVLERVSVTARGHLTHFSISWEARWRPSLRSMRSVSAAA